MEKCKEINFTDYATLNRNYTVQELADIYKTIILDIARMEQSND